MKALSALIVQKKDGTNGIAVRAGRPVTQTTPSFEGVGSPPSSPEYLHDTIDSRKSKYKN
jgi:hypothetical protein